MPTEDPDVCQMEAIRGNLSGRNEILIRHRVIKMQPDSRCAGIDDN